MKKRITLLLLSVLLLANATACNHAPEKDVESTFENTNTTESTIDGTKDGTSDSQTNNSDITDTAMPCAHTFGEWSVSKEATERENGEEKRTCSLCEYFETKPIHAKGTEGLSFTLSDDGASYSVNAGSATEDDVFIPAYHNGLPVTGIGYIGFANSDFEPEDIEIGSYAFFDCTDLKTVVIPSTVTIIGDMAFAGCESLESIVLPPAVTVIGDGAFEVCKNLESIVISPTVTVIGDYAFMLCESLESIVIPESVKEIGEYAFALTEVESPLGNYHSDIKVSIPNTQVILILREFSNLFSWGVEIYYLDENGSEISIGKIEFDDRSQSPFSNGDFEIINNNDNTFSVRAGDSEDKGQWIDHAFDIPQCVSVFVPKSEDTITVLYGGNDVEKWDGIDIAEGNVRLTKDNITVKKCVIYYYSETEPTEPNKYWHYVDGVPTIW